MNLKTGAKIPLSIQIKSSKREHNQTDKESTIFPSLFFSLPLQSTVSSSVVQPARPFLTSPGHKQGLINLTFPLPHLRSDCTPECSTTPICLAHVLPPSSASSSSTSVTPFSPMHRKVEAVVHLALPRAQACRPTLRKNMVCTAAGTSRWSHLQLRM